MKNLRSCMTVIGVGSILLGLLLLIAVLVGYDDPAGVSNRLGVNLLILGIFLAGFWGIGSALLYIARKMDKGES